MYMNEWHHGCRVSISDWIGKDVDGKTPIRIGIEYFRPGASLNRPEWERVIYCPRREEQKIRERIDSIVMGICSGSIPSVLRT